MNLFHVGLATLMLITGSINTLSVKWADRMSSECTDGKKWKFRHPFLQACGMFLGEMLCMLAFYIIRLYRKRQRRNVEEDERELLTDDDPFLRTQTWSPAIFLPPALCDMTATSIQYIGLTLTQASSFQMLRGAVIIFTGIFSRIFLGRKLRWFRWAGIFFVIVGLITVGLCDVLYVDDSEKSDTNSSRVFGGDHKNKSNTDILVGDLLIVGAQVIVATQMVYEERFVSRYDVHPLKAIGWEGTFGFLTLSTLLIPMYFIHVGPNFGHNPRHVMEDALEGLYQLVHNPLLALAFSMTIISIAFFNFAGISVTKEMSATTRMILDSARTLVIWMFSIPFFDQKFHSLQLLGFAFLIMGMFIYNDIVIRPGLVLIAQKFGFAQSVPLNNDNSGRETPEPENSLYEPRDPEQR